MVDKPPSVDEVRPKVVIRGKESFVLEHYPKDASGRLQYDKKLIEDLDMKTTDVLRNMCKRNPPTKIKRRTSSTSVCFAASYKAHVCFLSVILFLLTLQYMVWPGWGATYTSGLESTRGYHALKHKYHLPLTPPPPINFVFFVQIQVQICFYRVT